MFQITLDALDIPSDIFQFKVFAHVMLNDSKQ
jgi:hypothetical protein